MKPIRTSLSASFVGMMVLALASLSLSIHVARAHPYASNITGTNNLGYVSFTLNEDGTYVTIVYEDGTTNTVPGAPFNGSAPTNKGTHSFLLEAPHVGFKIICYKQGNGIPSIISSDATNVYTYTNSVWNSARGVAVNKNPAIGTNFGRLVVGNGANGTQVSGPKNVGLYLLNADQTLVKGPVASNFYAGSGANGPYRVRANDDGTFLVCDFSTINASLLQFSPDLSSSNLVLAGIGQTAAAAAGIHGDLFGCGIMKGSLAAGNLVLYTFDSGMPTPSDTNCIKGPLTSPGSFNCVFQYNIGSGPLPWNKRPDYAYTYGLDGIAELRTEGDVGKDGKIFCAFGRANASNPNLQILRPFLTTNGIAGDPVNAVIQDAAKSATNWLYTGGVIPPFNTPPNGAAADPWAGINGSGVLGGTYAGVRVSPDGTYVAAVDINNGITLANLTNGIPNEGTIFGINAATFPYTAPAGITGVGANTGNSRGMDWDPANNIWVISSGQALLRCYSLGLTTTCVSSNDWTGTNGTFSLAVPSLQSSVAVINGTASQNYVNNTVNAGTPIPGVFRISLNTNNTLGSGAVSVGFVRGGTAGIIGSITVTNGGSGYTSPPTVTFTGGAGAGASAIAVVTGGAVTAVIITSPGSGFTSVPVIGFTGGGGSGAGASGTIGLNFGQYSINTNETPNGVTIKSDSVIFPAGVFAGSNGPNWNVDVKVIPATNPVSGPVYAFNVRLVGGTNYSAAAPLNGSIAILNTGPQLLQLSAAAPATLGGMNRGIPNDQARFIVTRFGDTNGPNNDAVNAIVPRPVTISAINYYGTAQFPLDYTARAQNFAGALPVDGSPGIVINPGVVSVTAMIGNPVKHVDTNIRATNLTVIINFTNVCDTTATPGCNTNLLSLEGYPYRVSTAQLILNEFDNAVGGETVLWSNPLTNSLDSTNWTLVFGSILQGSSPTLPTVISNYGNSATVNGGPYYAWFGKPVNDPGNDGGVTVPPSDTMVANGWSSALKLTVNKDPNQAGESGINLYPQIPGAPWTGSNYMYFQGNYALRFDMFLSLYDFGLGNPAIGTPAREFAAFGINHRGTNVNWRLDINPRGDGTGARPINADGEWCAIDAASGSITPADYDMFISPGFVSYDANGAIIPQTIPFTTNNVFTTNASILGPFTNAYQIAPGVYSGVTNLFANAGVPNDQQSTGNNSFGGAPQNGIIKNPPFSGINNLGGAPDNAWVSVSLELTRQTNLTLLVARQPIFSSSITNPVFGTPNILAQFGGTPMLGYLDPNIDISDYSAFVYYSNIRLVELSPFIPWTNQPAPGLIVTQGSTFSLTSGATFASNPLTNMWYQGTTNGPGVATVTFGGIVYVNRENGTPTAALVTNSFAATNAINSITVANIQSGTNYVSTWSDVAGVITNHLSVIEVIAGPGDKTVTAGRTTNFTVVASGNSPPTSFQWMRGGTNIVNGTHFAGATTATLTISNVSALDATVYSNRVANAYGNVFPAGTLSVLLAPPTFTGVSVTNNNVVMSFTSPNGIDTTNSFTLLSCGVVNGTYTNTPGIFTVQGNTFYVTATNAADPQMFYRLQYLP